MPKDSAWDVVREISRPIYISIDKFLEITGLDSRGIAEYFLHLTYGDVKTAIDFLFGSSRRRKKLREDDFKDQEDIILPEVENSLTSGADEDAEIQILEWNIQGLYTECLMQRTLGVINVITVNQPTVVMLQEVVPITYRYLKNALMEKYQSFSPADMKDFASCGRYFTAIFVDHSVFKDGVARIVPFRNTTHARQLLIVDGHCYGHNITVMTAHFESMNYTSGQRKKQLAKVFFTMNELPSDRTVIFGGDTNLRDAEFSSVVKSKKLHLGRVKDVWTMLGCSNETKHTWNKQKNDNNDETANVKVRFERMYIRMEDGDNKWFFKPVGMRLVGTKRLPCGRFSSDHWGLLASFRT